MTEPHDHDHGPSGFAGLGRTEITQAEELTPVDRWRDDILAEVQPLDPIEFKLGDALGLVLAQDVTSPEPLPAFANSGMDGYAVRAADVERASGDVPAVLRVIGEIPAGATELPTVEAGCAVRIMTGAPVPPGADTVVPVEVTTEVDRQVSISRPGRRGEFVRGVGSDVPAGSTLLRTGHRLRPADIGLMAAVGHHRVLCRPLPRVIIVSTGDELVAADRRPGPGHIRDANGPMLSAMVRQAGAKAYWAGIVADDRKAIMNAFDSSLGHADMFIATGGVSAGAYDFVRDVLSTMGKVRTAKLAMKPGMPQVFGKIGEVPVFGLPGNPVSSFVSFEVFVRPAIRALQGRADRFRPRVTATLTEEVSSPPNKRAYARVRLARDQGAWQATPTGSQGSHVLTSVSAADGLAEIPESMTTAPAGTRVTVHLLIDG